MIYNFIHNCLAVATSSMYTRVTTIQQLFPQSIVVMISGDDAYPVEPPHTPNGPPLEAGSQQDEK